MVVFVVTGFCLSLLYYIWIYRAMQAVTSYGNSFIGDLSSVFGGEMYSPYQTPTPPISVLFLIWLAYLILLYAEVLGIFVGRKIIGDAASFLQIHDMYAQRIIPFAIYILALSLISLIGGYEFCQIMFTIGIVVFLVAIPIALIAQGVVQRHTLDSFWMLVLAILAWGAIVFVGVVIIVAMGKSSISSVVDQY